MTPTGRCGRTRSPVERGEMEDTGHSHGSRWHSIAAGPGNCQPHHGAGAEPSAKPIGLRPAIGHAYAPEPPGLGGQRSRACCRHPAYTPGDSGPGTTAGGQRYSQVTAGCSPAPQARRISATQETEGRAAGRAQCRWRATGGATGVQGACREQRVGRGEGARRRDLLQNPPGHVSPPAL